ncbi:hypothetical protein ACTXT7_003871 [Hymenolepis weldensis]
MPPDNSYCAVEHTSELSDKRSPTYLPRTWRVEKPYYLDLTVAVEVFDSAATSRALLGFSFPAQRCSDPFHLIVLLRLYDTI